MRYRAQALRAIGLGAWLAAAACGPRAPAAPPPASPGVAPAIVFARCVPHAGSTRRQQGAPASCWFNAECVERQGVFTAGDGDVAIACADGSCTCTLAPHAPGAAATSFTFTDASACEGEGGARQLLVTRCMPGR
ncbi:MAG TPA: hypothetical protein VMT03_09975 [Polyangia bacterium]|nr:hypothetical protein [Polyangia bacterium]